MDLNTPLDKIFRLNPNQKEGLKKLKLETVLDLLYYFPVRYGDYSKLSYIRNLQKGDNVNIYATVKSIQAKKTFKTKLTMTEAVIEEVSGDTIKVI